MCVMVQDSMARAASQTACGNYGGAVCHLDEAIACLETAVSAVSPAEEASHLALAACYSQRAACHREVGNFKAAISDMDRSIPILHALRGAPAVGPPAQSLTEQLHTVGMVHMVEPLIARGVLLEETEQHALSLEDFDAVLRIDATNSVALGAAVRLRAVCRGRIDACGRRCAQTSDGWKSVPRPAMRAFENRGKAGAAF